MTRVSFRRALAGLTTLVAVALGAGAVGTGWGCGARTPGLLPNAASSTRPLADAGAAASAYGETTGTPTAPKPVPSSMITHGTRAGEFSREPLLPTTPLCKKEERRALTFEHAPTYTEKIEQDGKFSARFFVGNTAPCSRRIGLPLSFTPPKMTTTRTVEFGAYVPPRGTFVELTLDPTELAEVNVTPGRYAITFAVFDEEGKPVGKALSGNPFRRGRDDIAITKAPEVPRRIGITEELTVPMSIENIGDTANRITPLIVFTRPGETAGIEHYDPQQLIVPGASTYTFRLSQQTREAEGILPGTWLVTVTMFDAAGERLNSFAGLPLAIGNIDVRMTRPELPTRVKSSEPLRATFKVDNRGDTKEKITAVVAFTKPGTTTSVEFAFTREILPGPVAFDAVIEPARRREKAVEKGVWLVSTAAFRSSGERIKSFTGHYLEIVE
ncbi:MAG TPA: hypothetical protein VM925_22520 [Labilithrix sp.]|nr:hypothetical protein [Labilithrix sp.]